MLANHLEPILTSLISLSKVVSCRDVWFPIIHYWRPKWVISFITKEWEEGLFCTHEIKIIDTTPCLHHLLFADDSFFFAWVTMEDCNVVQHVLYVYS